MFELARVLIRPDQVSEYAGRYDAAFDDPVAQLVSAVKSRGHLTLGELRIVAEWKTPRVRPKIAKNPGQLVEEASRLALAARSPTMAAHSLTALEGVGMPVASTILHWFHSDPYPILDIRALETLGAPQPALYSYSFWEEFVSFTRQLASDWRVDMRTLDRALWQFSKSKEG